MNNVNEITSPTLKIINQYIKDLSFENNEKVGVKNIDIDKNKILIDSNVIYESYKNNFFSLILRYKIEAVESFYLELDYFGFFKIEGPENYDKNEASKKAAQLLFPFVRNIIAIISQNGGIMPILLDNINISLTKD